ncbi:hypothetical protein C2845_PM06G32220 [Panicum miliaceum]|uniref:DUF1618 domain-containing protein n=1 Tax=Panicum miliaceum TaxID=4540 RepID=A0A3L6REB3_PANMI|nr:hypothetical protein C2845_PM06G32220 [Panicum miliaceum]
MPPPAQERWAILAESPRWWPPRRLWASARRSAAASPSTATSPPAPPCSPCRAASPPPPTNSGTPYVAAADPSGMILLSATQPFTSFSCVVSYHLCDAPTGKVTAIPGHFQPMGFHGDNVGLVRRGHEFMVAELRRTGDGSGRATLLCFTAGKYDWVEKKLMYFPPLDRRYFGEGVMSHGEMLWWVDLSYGLLACGPFADAIELFYVALPSVLDELPADPVSRGMNRCVKVSGGRLRSTAAKPVTFAAAQSRLTAVKPDTHDKGITLKRIRDLDDMQKEELEAKRMKVKAVFAEVIESQKKKLMGSLTMKEGANNRDGPREARSGRAVIETRRRARLEGFCSNNYVERCVTETNERNKMPKSVNFTLMLSASSTHRSLSPHATKEPRINELPTTCEPAMGDEGSAPPAVGGPPMRARCEPARQVIDGNRRTDARAPAQLARDAHAQR